MENVTSPGQVLFLFALFVAFCVSAGWWYFKGIPKDAPVEDISTVDLMREVGHNLLHWRPVPMSSAAEGEEEERAPVPPVVTARTAAEQSIATPNNEYSGKLSDNTAKTIATLYEAGMITNLSKAICKAYSCTVQSASKPDSTYQMALKEVNKYLPKKDAPQFRMTPEQEAAREALGLNR